MPSADAAKPSTRVWPGWVLAGTVAAAVAATVIATVVVPRGEPQALDEQSVVQGAREFFLRDGETGSRFVAEVKPPIPTQQGRWPITYGRATGQSLTLIWVPMEQTH